MTYLKLTIILTAIACCLILLSCHQPNQGKNYPADTAKISHLLYESDSIIRKQGEYIIDLQQAISLAKEAASLSTKHNYETGIAKADLQLASAYFEMKARDSGMIYCKRAMEIFKAAGNPAGEAACLIQIGHSFGDTHQDFIDKIGYYEKAVELYHTSGDKLKEAQTRQLVADLYGNDEQWEHALFLMQETMQLYREAGYKKLQEPYNLIGSIYLSMDNVVEARRYLLLAIKTVEELGDTSSGFMATVLNRIGMSHYHLGEYNLAIPYFEKALQVAELTHDTLAITTMCGNISDSKTQLGQYAASNDFLKKTTSKYPIQEGDEDRTATTAVMLMNNDLALKDFQDAAIRYQQLSEIYHKHDVNDPDFNYLKPYLIRYLQAKGQYTETYTYLDAYRKNLLYGKDFKRSARYEQLYAISDSALGKTASAIQHFQLYKAFSDSSQTLLKSKQIQELKIQYETDKKDKNIALLNSEKALQSIKMREARNLLFFSIGCAVLLLLFLGLLYNRYRLKQRSNRLLELQQKEINQQNELLKKLVTDKEWLLKEVHHRVKNNLQIAISLLNTQSRHLESEDAIAALQNSKRRIYAMSLVHQRLYQTDDLGNIDMRWYITGLIDFLKDSFSETGIISFYVDCAPISLDVVQAIPLGLILNEAISNSIKYAFINRKKGKISVILQKHKNEDYILSISDDGTGFNPASLNGTSLGMNLMRGLAEQVDGQLDIESSDSGVTITISFSAQNILPG